MSLVSIFSQSRPEIGGLIFDCTLSESSELQTEITEFPIESGAIGNDHAIQRPLLLTLRVGISDNPIRALAAQTDISAPVRNVGSSIGGFAVGQLPGNVAAALGLTASVANAAFAAGQAAVRSQSALDAIREIQRANEIIDVVTLKRSYQNCMIRATRQETTKENEGGLELVVELQQLLTVSSQQATQPIPAPNDPAETLDQLQTDLGLVVPR